MNNGSMTCRISFNLNYLRNLEKSKYFIFIEIFTTILREKQLDIKMKEVNHESTLFRNDFNTSPEKSQNSPNSTEYQRLPDTIYVQLQITPTTKKFKTCSKIQNKFFKQFAQIFETMDEIIICDSVGWKDMSKVNKLQLHRAFELLHISNLEGVKVINKKQTACIKMVTPLTAKEVHKLFQFLQENLGNKN